MDILINVANLIYLASYSVRDILWLRVLTVVAASILIPYYYFLPDQLMAPIYWNLVFISLNLFWIGCLLLERRPVHLDKEEQRLYRLAFRTLTPREMRALLKLGSWGTAAKDERILEHGQTVERLAVIVSGSACLEVNGRAVDEFEPGQFVGGISFVTDEPAPGDVVTLEPVRYVSWRKSDMKAYLEKAPELCAALAMILNVNLTKMLADTWSREAAQPSA